MQHNISATLTGTFANQQKQQLNAPNNHKS